MTNTLLKEFIDFVKSKPCDMKIDNDDGWSNCAVGKFFDEKFPDLNYHQKNRDIVEFALEIFQIDIDVVDIHSQWRLSDSDQNQIKVYKKLNHSRYKTYGELAEELSALEIQ